MPLRPKIPPVDGLAELAHGPARRAVEQAVGIPNAELRQPDGRFQVEGRIIAGDRRQLRPALEQVETDDELVRGHDLQSRIMEPSATVGCAR